MVKMIILVFSIFTLNFVSANETATAITVLKSMTTEYSSAPYMQLKFKQTQDMELLGETKKSKGELFYSSKKLRIELQGEISSSTLFTPGVITSINYDENKKPTQVIKSKPYPHPLIDLIFGQSQVWDGFKINEVKKDTSSTLDVMVEAKNPEKLQGIKEIEIVLNKKKLALQKVIYWDDIGNKTTYQFISQKKSDKIDGTKFILIPPKGIEIRNL